VPDIFDEINEDLRAERAQLLLKKYGWLIGVAALLIVGGVAGWEGWQRWQDKQDREAAAAYLSAMRIADQIRPGQRIPPDAILAFDRVARSAPHGYAVLARLREAGLKADAGDLAGAVRAWDEVASDRSVDSLFRDLATLLSVQRQVDTGNPPALEARLKPLENPDNAWHSLAEESQALLELRQGKTDQARDELRRLAQDVTAPEGVRRRANGLLEQLGG
jgi:hypothetical protein